MLEYPKADTLSLTCTVAESAIMTSFSVYGYDARMLDQFYGRNQECSSLDASAARFQEPFDPETDTPPSRCHLLSIPAELRAHIFSNILPRTIVNDTRRLNAWIRGSTSLLRTCKSLHAEAAHLMYGRSHFTIGIAWDSITFDCRYLWARPGSIRRRSYDFPRCFGEQYLQLIQTLVVKIHIVDNYLGMIKYNHHNSAGLLHGYRTQVEHLCTVLEQLPHLKRLGIWFRDDSMTPGADEAVLSPFSHFRAARTSISPNLSGVADHGYEEGLSPLSRSLYYPDYHQVELCFDIMSA